jgi:Flp pilus assembly protein TadG
MKLRNLTNLKQVVIGLRRSERGSSVVELAIVFPILLMLFAGTAELGRLFYTYTTLAKATKVGARYLSTQKAAESTDAATILDIKTKAARLVICGYTDNCTGNQPDGTPKKPIVPGLNMSDPLQNVSITLPPTSPSVVGPRYVVVQITGYTFQPGVFNVASVTDSSSATFYFALAPATRMRYMH